MMEGTISVQEISASSSQYKQDNIANSRSAQVEKQKRRSPCSAKNLEKTKSSCSTLDTPVPSSSSAQQMRKSRDTEQSAASIVEKNASRPWRAQNAQEFENSRPTIENAAQSQNPRPAHGTAASSFSSTHDKKRRRDAEKLKLQPEQRLRILTACALLL